MKKLRLISLFVFWIIGFSMYAQKTVIVEDAQKVALTVAQTFKSSGTGGTLRSAGVPALDLVYTAAKSGSGTGMRSATPNDEVYYYIFNVNQNQGFVIVAGNDIATPVLGYSDSGGWSSDNLPPNLEWWMSQYKEQIKYALNHSMKTDAVTQKKWTSYVSGNTELRSAVVDTTMTLVVVPLLGNIAWNQRAPYNNMVVKLLGDYPTGCVATATAQIMYYWAKINPKQFKAQSTSIPEYVDGNKIKRGPLSATTFDWQNMTATYSGSSTSVQNDAVAKLMYYVGIGSLMTYSPGASGAFIWNAKDALINYFGYNNSAIHWMKSEHSSEWITTIKNNLDAGQPILYQGGQEGIHAFVCDGYDNRDYLHFNWGWGGAKPDGTEYPSNNGYFTNAIDNLPTFNSGQQAVFNIKPDNCTSGPASPTGLLASNVNNSGATLTWSGAQTTRIFMIEYKKSTSSTWSSVKTANSPFTFRNLVANTEYNCRVTAVNSCGASAVSNQINFKTTNIKPNPPSNVKGGFNSQENAFTFSWTKSTNCETGYDIFYNGGSTPVCSVAETEDHKITTVNGVTPTAGITYNFTIIAKSGTVFSNSDSVKITIPIKPTVTNISSINAEVSWPARAGVTSYGIFIKKNNGKWELSKSGVTSPTTVDINRVNQIYVTAKVPGSIPDLFLDSEVQTFLSVIQGTVTNTTAVLSWEFPLTGIASYEVYNTATNVKMTTNPATVSGTSTSCMVTGLSANTTYSFTVKSRNASGTLFAGNNILSVTTLPNSPVLNQPLVANITSSNVALTWTVPAGGSSSYNVYRGTVKINTSPITATNYTVTGLTANTSYTFTVKAVNSAGAESTASNAVSVLTPPNPPTNLAKGTVTNNSAALSWTAPSGGAARYNVYNGTQIMTTNPATVTSTSCTVTGLAGNTSYNFTVKSVNSAGAESAASNLVSVLTLPNAPTGLIGGYNAAANKVYISWTASAGGATGYDILKDGLFLGSSNGTATTFETSSGLVTGNTYVYTVKAKNASGSSAASNAFSIRLPNSPTIVPNTITDTSVRLNWDAVQGVKYYSINNIIFSKDSISGTVTNLQPNTSYSIYVAANVGDNIWIDSKSTPIKTAPAIPTNLKTTVNTDLVPLFGGGNVVFSCSPSAGAIRYEYRWKLHSSSTYLPPPRTTIDTTVYSNLSIPAFLLSINENNNYSPGLYDWQVRAKNASGAVSDWSPAGNFTILPAPVVSDPVTTATNATLKWQPVSGTTGYEIQYGTTSNTLYSAKLDAGSATSMTINLAQGNYKWRVIAKGTNAISLWSGGTFTINALKSATDVTAIDNVDGAKEVSLYPNPVRDILTVKGLDNTGETVNAIVYDMTGSVVKTVSVKAEGTIRINVSNLPKNSYILSIEGKKLRFIKN